MAIYLAPGLGIEPRLTESKSVVLPLHNPGTEKTGYIIDGREAHCSTAERICQEANVGIEPTCR